MRNVDWQEIFIKRAKEVHGDKYDYSKVEYKNAKTPVTIICPIHGEFQQAPYHHLEGSGCKKCADEAHGRQMAMSKEEFIARATEIHHDKYDYSKVEYVNNNTDVCIICPEHGKFWQKPSKHLAGHGCQVCGGSKKNTTAEFIEKARKIHGDKYDYSKVEYVNNKTMVTITCPKHGDFIQRPYIHLSGCGCPRCGDEENAAKHLKSMEDVLKEARRVHGDKYDYSKAVYIGCDEKMEIVCPIHGPFWQVTYNHMRGCGCPACASEKVSSQAEVEIAAFVKTLVGEENVKCNTRSVIPPYELDMYIPSMSVAIEYNGLYWHSVKQGKDKNYHLNKLRRCNSQGVRLIQIFEDEWIEHKDVVLNKIKHILHKDNCLNKIMARKCEVREIANDAASEFLDKYHIQGSGQATVSLGCFFEEKLIAAMMLKRDRKDGDTWELTRFASSSDIVCQGVGGKLFKYFLKKYNPSSVKSFADRRWTLDKDDNLYTKLGFALGKECAPDYRYVVGNERKHKFGFRKQILSKKFGLPLTMTESEMCDKLGFDKIYDCGLLKYVWKREY